jgi:hypothetical protein
MAAPGRMAKAKQREIIEWLAADRRVLGSAFVRSPTLGKIRDASHPRGSVGAGFAGGTEPLAGT